MRCAAGVLAPARVPRGQWGQGRFLMVSGGIWRLRQAFSKSLPCGQTVQLAPGAWCCVLYSGGSGGSGGSGAAMACAMSIPLVLWEWERGDLLFTHGLEWGSHDCLCGPGLLVKTRKEADATLIATP